MTVKAGTHEIACKLVNGYSGDAKFAIVDSMTSDSLDASVSGNKRTVTVQGTGISATGCVLPTEPAQDDKDDGLSLTDILRLQNPPVRLEFSNHPAEGELRRETVWLMPS